MEGNNDFDSDSEDEFFDALEEERNSTRLTALISAPGLQQQAQTIGSSVLVNGSMPRPVHNIPLNGMGQEAGLPAPPIAALEEKQQEQQQQTLSPEQFEVVVPPRPQSNNFSGEEKLEQKIEKHDLGNSGRNITNKDTGDVFDFADVGSQLPEENKLTLFPSRDQVLAAAQQRRVSEEGGSSAEDSSLGGSRYGPSAAGGGGGGGGNGGGRDERPFQTDPGAYGGGWPGQEGGGGPPAFGSTGGGGFSGVAVAAKAGGGPGSEASSATSRHSRASSRRSLLAQKLRNPAGGRLSAAARSVFRKRGRRRGADDASEGGGDVPPTDPRLAELEGWVGVKAKKKPRGAEFADLALLQSVNAHRGAIWTLAFSPDGALLASGGQDTVLLVWRVSRESRISRDLRRGGGGGGGGGSADQNDAVRLKEAIGALEGRPFPDDGSDAEENASLGGGVPGGGGVGPECCDALFLDVPIRRYAGHTADIIDVSWSRTDFLLSASIDKTVRLWHATREDCLHHFQHSDFVTGVDFHPTQEKLFVSGCFDKKVRLWNIPDGRVKEWIQAPEIVTAAKFGPDGATVVAGLYHGQIIFYQTDGMRYYTQVECRNRKGPLRNGRKVTGLAFAHLPPGGSNAAGGGGASPRGPTAAGGGGGGAGGAGSVGVGVGEGTGTTGGGGHQLLVTTNDSRLRLYRVDDYLMACKYKGLANDSMQIKASFSEDNRYIICGSENGRVYIWATQRKGDKDGGSTGANPGRRDRNNAHESFMAAGGDPAIATVAQFVPARAVRHALRPADAAPFPEHDQEHVNAMVISADYNGTIRVYCRSKFKR